MEANGGILDEIEEFGQGKPSQSTSQYGMDLMCFFCFFRTTIVKAMKTNAEHHNQIAGFC